MFIKDLERNECFEILAENSFGRLACARESQPYIVPFHFAFDGQNSLYAFSTFGQKIEWMRANPLVCVETDDVKNDLEWTSLVIFGRYEELTDTPEFEIARNYAHELLSRRAMWWQPAYVAGAHRPEETNAAPIYFRIDIENISGHRAIPDGSRVQTVPEKSTANKS